MRHLVDSVRHQLAVSDGDNGLVGPQVHAPVPEPICADGEEAISAALVGVGEAIRILRVLDRVIDVHGALLSVREMACVTSRSGKGAGGSSTASRTSHGSTTCIAVGCSTVWGYR